MNEYRVQELNVQNGVLKSLSFLFEYIGASCCTCPACLPACLPACCLILLILNDT